MIPMPISPMSYALRQPWYGCGSAYGMNSSATEARQMTRPDPALVLVSDRVQDEALPRGEAQTEPPALPANLPAADVEARPLGLDDLERLEIISQRTNAVGGVGARTRRQRHDPQVLHPHYRHVIQVHDGMKAVDRLGVRVVIRPLTIEQQRPHDPSSRILGCRERADAPWLYTHLRGIGDAAALKPGPDPGVSPRHDFALNEFRRREWRAASGTGRQDRTEPTVRDTTAS